MKIFVSCSVFVIMVLIIKSIFKAANKCKKIKRKTYAYHLKRLKKGYNK